MRRPYSIQVFLYREPEPQRFEFLLFNRVARPELGLPEFWQGISGALEQNESFQEAAIREVMEESGIRVTCATASEFVSTYPIRPEWRAHYGSEPSHVEERVFYCKVSSDSAPELSPEHREWRWCSTGDALAKLSFGDNRAALQSVLARIEKGPNSFESALRYRGV